MSLSSSLFLCPILLLSSLCVLVVLSLSISVILTTDFSFLDDIDRIATRAYLPSDDDVIRARLRTLGVQEYQIKVEPSSPNTSMNPSGAGVGRPSTSKSTSSNLGDLAHSAIGKPIGNEWMLYDVGGSRTIVSFFYRFGG